MLQMDSMVTPPSAKSSLSGHRRFLEGLTSSTGTGIIGEDAMERSQGAVVDAS